MLSHYDVSTDVEIRRTTLGCVDAKFPALQVLSFRNEPSGLNF